MPNQTAAALSVRRPRVADVRVTPIAFRDPPLLNVVGVHEPWALRSIIEVETDDGRIGLGESYGDLETLGNLDKAKGRLVGLDPHDTNALVARVHEAVTGQPFIGQPFPAAGDKALASAIGAFEVAFLDLQAQIAGCPLYQLLGGAVRDRVAYSAYLFYKFARHKDDPGYPPDDWGEALDHAQIVDQTKRMVNDYGFGSIKLKAGVFDPDFEIESLRALRKAFPNHPLRIDPNGGWSVETTRRLMPRFDGLLEYLEDPVNSLDEMGEVAKFSTLPLATNMVTVAFGHVPKTVRLNAVQVILSDHHYWGGLRATQALAHYGRTFGIGISMHSNSHLGISLAAMTHVGMTIPNLAYACDTHYPWQVEEVVDGGREMFRFEAGSLSPPSGPGLGVKLDRSALSTLHHQYVTCGIRKRDDAKEMRKYRPDWNSARPRF
ncbi:MAG: glucarate dehydratase [Alphaproteobacteria bacterium]|nr:glucarate dehydratase [Alphaproteobacteria bacterium]